MIVYTISLVCFSPLEVPIQHAWSHCWDVNVLCPSQKSLPWLSLTKSCCYSDRMILTDPNPGHWRRWNHKPLLTPPWGWCAPTSCIYLMFSFLDPCLIHVSYSILTFHSCLTWDRDLVPCLSFLPFFPKYIKIASWCLKIHVPIFFTYIPP